MNYESRFKGKHLCQSLFLNELAGLRVTTFSKKTAAQAFPASFASFLKVDHYIFVSLFFKSKWEHLSN